MNAQSNLGPVDFDLSRGRVDRRADSDTKGGQDDQVVLVPVTALAGLAKITGVAMAQQLARSIGMSFGSRVAAKLGSTGGMAKASVELFVSALAGEIAVSGWGVLHLERWGRAMVLVLDHAPGLPQLVLASLLEGAVSAAAGREVHAVALAKETGDSSEARVARVLIVSAKTAVRVRRWLLDGATEADVMRRLHEDTSSTGGTA